MVIYCPSTVPIDWQIIGDSNLILSDGAGTHYYWLMSDWGTIGTRDFNRLQNEILFRIP